MARLYRNAAIIEWHYIAEEGNPKLDGLYFVASRLNPHRVFTCHYRPEFGWSQGTKGRHLYAWAALPDFPPLSPQI